jgi:hypothetical protein
VNEWRLNPGSEDYSVESVEEADSEFLSYFGHCWKDVLVDAKDDECYEVNDTDGHDFAPFDVPNPNNFTLSSTQLQSGYPTTTNFDQYVPQTPQLSDISIDATKSDQLQDSSSINVEQPKDTFSSTIINPESCNPFDTLLRPLTSNTSAVHTSSLSSAIHPPFEAVSCDFLGCNRAFEERKKLKYEVSVYILAIDVRTQY